MLVHFIGGPAHGRSEAIQNPHEIWRMVEYSGMPAYVSEGAALPPLAKVPYTEHSYRITRRTPRYAVAEWQAPPVNVRFEVIFPYDPSDERISNAMRKIFLAPRGEAKHGVRCVGAHIGGGWEGRLELITTVDGPDDATALQLASEKVQHYLDAELPTGVTYQVSATSE